MNDDEINARSRLRAAKIISFFPAEGSGTGLREGGDSPLDVGMSDIGIVAGIVPQIQICPEVQIGDQPERIYRRDRW